MKKRYTEEFKQQVADLYHKGNKSIGKIESEYGASRSSIHGTGHKNYVFIARLCNLAG